MLAVEREVLQRRRFVLRCLAIAALTAGLLYLELPLRAGPFPAPLVYGHPETLAGFLYVVLGAQFAGSVGGPLADIGPKLADLLATANAQFGPLAWFIPVALVVTAIRRPRYALLTVPGVVLTCWFAESYQNAEIWRYLLGPALIVVSWLAILAAELVGALERAVDRAPKGSLAWSLGSDTVDGERGPASPAIEVGLALLLVVSSLSAIPATWQSVDRSADRSAPEWLDAVLPKLDPHGVVISWWSYSTPLWYAQVVEGKIPGIAIVDDRTRLDEGLGSVEDVINSNLGRRAVYLVREPADLAPLAATYALTLVDSSDPGQPVYEVTGRLGTTP